MEAVRGAAADLLAESADRVGGPGPLVRTVRVLDVTGATLVLGSGQRESDVDRDDATARGVEVTRRRSGGGAVLLTPADVLWVDLILPVGDPLWHPDIGRAAWWVGEVWATAIEAVGVGGATVWRGPLRRTEWSDRICFAGLGPGEVSVADRKVVGVAQRRTRFGALFQTAALLRWDPDPIVALLDLPAEDKARAVAAIGPGATGVGTARRKALSTAFLRTLMQ